MSIFPCQCSRTDIENIGTQTFRPYTFSPTSYFHPIKILSQFCLLRNNNNSFQLLKILIHTRFILKFLLTHLSQVTSQLLEVNIQRFQYIETLRNTFNSVAPLLGGETIYFLTLRELETIAKNRSTSNDIVKANKRKSIFKKLKIADKVSSTNSISCTDKVSVTGLCIVSGKVTGKALVLNKPITPELVTSVSSSEDILITKSLQTDFAWLPLLRLFKGIVLESEGYLDTGKIG